MNIYTLLVNFVHIPIKYHSRSKKLLHFCNPPPSPSFSMLSKTVGKHCKIHRSGVFCYLLHIRTGDDLHWFDIMYNNKYFIETTSFFLFFFFRNSAVKCFPIEKYKKKKKTGNECRSNNMKCGSLLYQI